jgi:cytosine/adenosine deaminase-related metal-dependent hydrolase
MNNATFWLTNVRLESGYRRENGMVTGTETEVCHIRVKAGKIAEIISGSNSPADSTPKTDARNMLALPSLVEKHCHLDKSYLGTSWKAARPAGSLFERFEDEKRNLASLPVPIADRARVLLDRFLQAGSTHIRTHVDISPDVGLSRLEGVQEALAAYEGKLSYEIVAFPQDGLLRSQSADLMKEAVRRGCGLVGGVDPANVDGDIERSLQQMMEIAVQGNADVDLHLHDPGHLGLFTIKRLAALTVEAGYQGRVAVSHAYCLGHLSQAEVAGAAEVLAEAGITIITSVPIDSAMPPAGLLREKGVRVAVGSDNIFDSWSSFGNGDILERAGRLAERFGWSDEHALSQALWYVTGGRTPLDASGARAWPRVGDDASMVFVEACCTAEAVARRASRPAVMYKGTVVAGAL